MKKKRGNTNAAISESRFWAESAYADSMLKSAMGDIEGCIASLELSLRILPDHAPSILSLGSVEYQRGRRHEGKALFTSLVELPQNTADLAEIVDKAGSFLIHQKEYADGLDLFRKAVTLFPRIGALHQGHGCCAGHQGEHAEAVQASRAALALEPTNQELVNDLGWCLLEAGNLEEAERILKQAVAMNPADALARENLRYCRSLACTDESVEERP
jgi:Flp pilus assembly protein TadD